MWSGLEQQVYGWMSWREFQETADVEYNASYGSQNIAPDLLVVGEDWWLERRFKQ